MAGLCGRFGHSPNWKLQWSFQSQEGLESCARKALTREGSGEGHQAHHHFIPGDLVAEVEGDKVRLSANGDVAVLHEEEPDGTPRH